MQEDYYRQLRSRMRDWLSSDEGRNNKLAEYLMFVPDIFHLLCKLMVDQQVPKAQKLKLAAVIAYFIAPADLIPELITGPVGFVDDLAAASFVLNGVVAKTPPSVIKKHWAGDAEVLTFIQHVLNSADSMLGSRLWRRLRRRF